MNESNLGLLEQVTDDQGLIVSLAEARAHMRYASADTSQNDNIVQSLYAAQQYCEEGIGGERQLISATYDLPLRNWWGLGMSFNLNPNGPGWRQFIPRTPLQSVEWVKYYDQNSTLQTLDPALYQVRTPYKGMGSVEWLPYHSWPVPLPLMQFPITIRFTCGYGPSTTTASSISAGSAQTVTPVSMFGIYAGTRLRIGSPSDTAGAEVVTVITAGASTFTANFSYAHATTPVPIVGFVPPVIRQAILLLISHWDKNREAVFVVEGRGGVIDIPYAVDALLNSQDWGFYA